MSQFHRSVDIHRKHISSIYSRDIVFIDGNRGFQIVYQIAGNNIHCRILCAGCINKCNHTHYFIAGEVTTTQSHSTTFFGTKTKESVGGIVAGDQISGSPCLKCVIAIYGWNIGDIGQRISVKNCTLICNKILAQILRENDTRFEFNNIGNINC